MWIPDAEPGQQDIIHKGIKYAMNCHHNTIKLNRATNAREILRSFYKICFLLWISLC